MLIEFNVHTKPGRLMLGVVYDRIYNFYQEQDPHIDLEQTVYAVFQRLTNKDDTMKLLIRLDEAQIVGHILMSIEQEFGVKVVFIHQAIFDDGHTTKEERHDWLEYTEHFGRQHQAHRLVLMTNRHPRSFEKNYGFKVHRTIMTKDIQPLQHLANNNGYLTDLVAHDQQP